MSGTAEHFEKVAALVSDAVAVGTETGDYVEVHESELLKIRNALRGADRYLSAMNEMNAALHRDDVVYSPLTVVVQQAYARVQALLTGVNSQRKEKEEA